MTNDDMSLHMLPPPFHYPSVSQYEKVGSFSHGSYWWFHYTCETGLLTINRCFEEGTRSLVSNVSPVCMFPCSLHSIRAMSVRWHVSSSKTCNRSGHSSYLYWSSITNKPTSWIFKRSRSWSSKCKGQLNFRPPLMCVCIYIYIYIYIHTTLRIWESASRSACREFPNVCMRIENA
jgi:hypothetical protein